MVCDLVGDYLLQTDWQALHKRGGLGVRTLWRAVRSCRISRTTRSHSCRRSFWLAGDIGAWAIATGALIAVPHWIQDDGRLLTRALHSPGEAH